MVIKLERYGKDEEIITPKEVTERVFNFL